MKDEDIRVAYQSFRGIVASDLPGENGDQYSEDNFNVIYRSISLLLKCCVSPERAEYLLQTITSQAYVSAINFVNDYEFILNEIKFETRKTYTRTKFTEKEILEIWTKQVIAKTNYDNALDFYNMVLKCRKEREAVS